MSDNPIIDEVRAANDIVDVVGERVRLTRKSANYFGLCPFHSEKTPSFAVSPRKQMYYCFGCGAGGDVFSFLMQYENLSFQESLKELAERAHITLPAQNFSKEASEKNALKNELLMINKLAAYFFVDVLKSPEGREGYNYLKKRGLDNRIIAHFGLGFSPKKPDALYRYLKDKGYKDDLIKASGLAIYNEKTIRDKFWNRVIFPIMDTNNRVTGFGGRVLGDGEPKYLNSPETAVFDKSQSIYGLNFAKISRCKFLILTEGYMDVITLHQYGFTNAVASLGTALNEKHARILKRYTDNIVLCEDMDEAGIRAKTRAYPILYQAGINVKVMELNESKDPDEFLKKFGPDAFEKCLNNAKNGFIYTIEVLKRDYDLADPAGKTAFFKAVAFRLTLFREPLERGNYIDSVSSAFFIDRDELKDLVERMLESGRSYGVSQLNYEGKPTQTPKTTDEISTRVQSKEAKNEMLLISWILSFPSLKDKVFEAIEPEELEVSVYREIASEIKDKGEIDTNLLMDKYRGDDEKQRLLSGVMIETDKYETEASLSRSDLEKGITESIRKLKLSSIDRKIRENETDLAMVSELLKERNSLQRLTIF